MPIAAYVVHARQAIFTINSIRAGTSYKDVIYMIFQLRTYYTNYTLNPSSIYFSTTTRVVIPESERHVKNGRCSRVCHTLKGSKCGTTTTRKQTESDQPHAATSACVSDFDFLRDECLYDVKCRFSNSSQKIETSCYLYRETIIKTLKHRCANIVDIFTTSCLINRCTMTFCIPCLVLTPNEVSQHTYTRPFLATSPDFNRQANRHQYVSDTAIFSLDSSSS